MSLTFVCWRLIFNPLSKGITNSRQIELPLQITYLFFDNRKEKAFYLLLILLVFTSTPLSKKNRNISINKANNM